MSIATAKMKAKDIRRRVLKTKTKPLLLLDKLVDTDGEPYEPDSDNSVTTEPYTLIGAVNIWDYERAARGQRGEVRYRFFIQENVGVATPEVLDRCTLCFGDAVMEVIARDAPDGERESVAWVFLATPSGDTFNGA